MFIYIYLHLYIYMCVFVCVCVYVYMCKHNEVLDTNEKQVQPYNQKIR